MPLAWRAASTVAAGTPLSGAAAAFMLEGKRTVGKKLDSHTQAQRFVDLKVMAGGGRRKTAQQ
jgi:hypothetical protein